MEDSMSSEESLVDGTDDSTTQEIVLETFSHQVGGRSLILTYDHNTVCKPLNPQELRFYLDLPESLRPFTPHYKGVVKVDVKVDDGGKIKLISNTSPRTTCDVDLKYNPDIEEDEQMISSRNQEKKDRNHHTDTETGSINPWTFHCHNLHHKRLTDSLKSKKSIEFMLLEDLVHNYTTPCIMDLKMGSTMHSSYTDQEKYARQKAKVQSSTSKTLGVRIAGIQMYNHESKNYVYHNKYYGFQLQEQGFKEELSSFVCNGTNQLRKDVVLYFIDKLQKLYTCLQQEDKLQFFSSSILLIYEAEQSNGVNVADGSVVLKNKSQQTQSPNGVCTVCVDHTQKKKDVKMIDFARSFHYTTKLTPVGADESYLLGLRSLIKLLNEILDEH